jgi:hypothetical protein
LSLKCKREKILRTHVESWDRTRTQLEKTLPELRPFFFLETALAEYGGAKVRRVNDAVYAGAVGALKLAMGLPAESWKRLQTVRQRGEAALAA